MIKKLAFTDSRLPGQHYALSATSGVIAAGLDDWSEVFAFGWNHGSHSCLVRDLEIGAGGIAGFTAGFYSFDLYRIRELTSPFTIGTAVDITAPSSELDTTFEISTGIVADYVRIASTSNLDDPSEGHQDVLPIASVAGGVTATAGIQFGGKLLDGSRLGVYPLLLRDDEGFVIRATVPATGTWTFSVSMKYSVITARQD